MPIKSDKQKHFMQAVEHNVQFAKKVGIKQQVAKEILHPGMKPVFHHTVKKHS